MRLVNYKGRATIVVRGRAVDVEHATGGQLSSNPTQWETEAPL